MADIELTIKIPEEIYSRYMNYTENYVDFMFFGTEEKVVRAIRNGTPLPKSHGRLIDADYMIKQLLSLPKNELSTEDIWAMKVLDLTPTIIEAESEE